MASSNMARTTKQGSHSIALGLLLLLACSTWASAAVARQRTFTSHPQPLNTSSHSPSLPDRKPLVHLSHSGLYLSSPISRNAPHFLTLSVASPLYDIESVKITTGKTKQRNWEQTHLECGGLEEGGIEACEKDDLQELQRNEVSITQTCEPYKIIPSQSRVLISTESCPSLHSLLAVETQSDSSEPYLDSMTLSFDLKRVFPTRNEKHSYWIGKLVKPISSDGDGRALWPYALERRNDTQRRTLPWDGRRPNPFTTQMQDPYMPKAYQTEATDALNGVDLIDSTWSYGISILSPTNGNVSKPTDTKYQAVHAPVAGQIVWMGNYTIPMAPSNHRNDENGYAVMIRDEWGFVYQLLGLEEEAMEVRLGQVIDAGRVVGSSSRTPLSQEPPCRHKPADPPKMYDDSRRYPYRNRVLRVRVTRPDPTWTEWKGPSESGWQYFNPLDAFTSDYLESHVPPDVNPKQLYFARPSEDGALTPPSVFATTNDIFQPTLSGNVEIIAGFDAFISLPGNTGGQLDPTALYALEWAVWPQADNALSDPPEACSKPDSIEWRTTFEHAKVRLARCFSCFKILISSSSWQLPNAWSVSLVKNALLAHYVPAFLVGTIPFFKTKYASSFDEKGRKLYYSPTRNLVGLPSGSGYWDTSKEPSGNGIYDVRIRGRDWFGNVGCFGATVSIKN